mgnify:CR=1 FL=1
MQSYRGLLHPIETPSNVFVDMQWRKGDLEAGFRESDVIVENTFTTRAVHQAYIEPHASVAYWEASGKLVVHSSTQNPSVIRTQLADLFKLLGALLHHEAHERLEALKALYDPLDPDAPPSRREVRLMR